MPRYGRLAALVAIYLVVGHLIPPPAAITPQGWRLFAIFLAVIAGQMLQPLPAAAIVILGLAAMAANGTPMREVLGGYAEPSVWLVLTAMVMARVLLDTGLARRIALLFIRQFGARSLGVAYALVLTDVTLAAGVPSITARSGGMVMPVGKAIAELFDSTPGPTASASARFSSRDVSGIGGRLRDVPHRPGEQHPRRVDLALKLVDVEVTWSGWLVAAIVPGIAVVPGRAVGGLRALPPEIARTPEAAAFARSELARWAGSARDEAMALAVFVGRRPAVADVRLAPARRHASSRCSGSSTLLLTRDARLEERRTGEAPAWDVFIWYGGLLKMGELLNDTGVTKVFAEQVGGAVRRLPVDGRAAADAARLLLRALLLRQHHRAHAGDVPAVRRRC